MLPKIFLISRTLTEEQIEQIKQALFVTPVDVVVVGAPQDTPVAKHFSEAVTGLDRPIAIVADFESPLSAVLEDGKVVKIHV